MFSLVFIPIKDLTTNTTVSEMTDVSMSETINRYAGVPIPITNTSFITIFTRNISNRKLIISVLVLPNIVQLGSLLSTSDQLSVPFSLCRVYTTDTNIILSFSTMVCVLKLFYLSLSLNTVNLYYIIF